MPLGFPNTHIRYDRRGPSSDISDLIGPLWVSIRNTLLKIRGMFVAPLIADFAQGVLPLDYPLMLAHLVRIEI